MPHGPAAVVIWIRRTLDCLSTHNSTMGSGGMDDGEGGTTLPIIPLMRQVARHAHDNWTLIGRVAIGERVVGCRISTGCVLLLHCGFSCLRWLHRLRRAIPRSAVRYGKETSVRRFKSLKIIVCSQPSRFLLACATLDRPSGRACSVEKLSTGPKQNKTRAPTSRYSPALAATTFLAAPVAGGSCARRRRPPNNGLVCQGLGSTN
ncbi:uncharacterized protein BKA78DRAFT_16435 [Phyllosticta capitalensis]|uniref:uncharacterized protein n=1 Tax=Phyllosticta capitalensis TaxID=121624 RepID=UPI00312E43A1